MCGAREEEALEIGLARGLENVKQQVYAIVSITCPLVCLCLWMGAGEIVGYILKYLSTQAGPDLAFEWTGMYAI